MSASSRFRPQLVFQINTKSSRISRPDNADADERWFINRFKSKRIHARKEHFKMSEYEAREALARKFYTCPSFVDDHPSSLEMQIIWKAERSDFWGSVESVCSLPSESPFIPMTEADLLSEVGNMARRFNCEMYLHDTRYVEIFSESGICYYPHNLNSFQFMGNWMIKGLNTMEIICSMLQSKEREIASRGWEKGQTIS
jgi:hypothetical protein